MLIMTGRFNVIKLLLLLFSFAILLPATSAVAIVNTTTILSTPESLHLGINCPAIHSAIPILGRFGTYVT